MISNSSIPVSKWVFKTQWIQSPLTLNSSKIQKRHRQVYAPKLYPKNDGPWKKYKLSPASNMAWFFWVITSLKFSVGDYPSKQAFTPSLALTGHPPWLAEATYGRDVQFFQEDWEVPWEPKKPGSFAVEKSEKKNTPTSSEIDLNNDISYPTIFGQHKSWIDSIVIHRDLKTILLVATFNDILPVDIIFHYVLPYLYLAATIFLATFRRLVVFQRFFCWKQWGKAIIQVEVMLVDWEGITPGWCCVVAGSESSPP